MHNISSSSIDRILKTLFGGANHEVSQYNKSNFLLVKCLEWVFPWSYSLHVFKMLYTLLKTYHRSPLQHDETENLKRIEDEAQD